MIHNPVLVDKVIEYLQPRSGGIYIDATLGAGGHARMILEKIGSEGTVLGIEQDLELAKKIEEEHIKNLIIENASYITMEQLVKLHKLDRIDGVLFDFGMNSWHVDASGRGFSFSKDEVLDMRFDTLNDISAAHIINQSTSSELEDIFRTYGEERRARRIAEAIVEERKNGRILTTGRLTSIISRIVPKSARHPATRVFQALRIAVNRELDNVAEGLAAAFRLVSPGGRVVAIAFHSLEDRIVKQAMRDIGGGHVLTKKAVRATRVEYLANPRSRSAVLRAWEKGAI